MHSYINCWQTGSCYNTPKGKKASPLKSIEGLQRLKLEALVAEAKQLLRRVRVQHHSRVLQNKKPGRGAGSKNFRLRTC
jgi:hypothetical protein